MKPLLVTATFTLDRWVVYDEDRFTGANGALHVAVPRRYHNGQTYGAGVEYDLLSGRFRSARACSATCPASGRSSTPRRSPTVARGAGRSGHRRVREASRRRGGLLREDGQGDGALLGGRQRDPPTCVPTGTFRGSYSPARSSPAVRRLAARRDAPRRTAPAQARCIGGRPPGGGLSLLGLGRAASSAGGLPPGGIRGPGRVHVPGMDDVPRSHLSLLQGGRTVRRRAAAAAPAARGAEGDPRRGGRRPQAAIEETVQAARQMRKEIEERIARALEELFWGERPAPG